MTEYGARFSWLRECWRNLSCWNGHREDGISDEEGKRMLVENQSTEKKGEKDVEEQLEETERTINEQQADMKKLEKEITTLRLEYENVLKRCKEEEAAKQEALTRLHQHIPLKLADNNPNIADLSDINRPTNLVEKFSLLYDDEWTEAFEALQQLPEYRNDEKAIKLLLDFVMFCFKLCREKSTNQLKSMLSIKEESLEQDKVPTEMKKLLKETRKKCAGLYIPLIHNIVVNNLKEKHEELMQEKAVDVYVKRCTELCWLMSVQDPPMALTIDIGNDRRYNQLKFRKYKEVGPLIDHIVWPAVLIQDGGDLLAKGVVRCCDSIVEPKQPKVVQVVIHQKNEENIEGLMFEKPNVDHERSTNISQENIMFFVREKGDVIAKSATNENEETESASSNVDAIGNSPANTHKANPVADKSTVIKQERDNFGSIMSKEERDLAIRKAARQASYVADKLNTSSEENNLSLIDIQSERLEKYDQQRPNFTEEGECFKNDSSVEDTEIKPIADTNESVSQSESEKVLKKKDELVLNDSALKEVSEQENRQEKEMNLQSELNQVDADCKYNGEERAKDVLKNEDDDTSEMSLQENKDAHEQDGKQEEEIKQPFGQTFDDIVNNHINDESIKEG